MSRGSTYFFAIDDGEFGRIGGSDLSIRKCEIVIGDGEKREVGILGGGDHLGQAAATARSIRVNVNHTDTLTW